MNRKTLSLAVTALLMSAAAQAAPPSAEALPQPRTPTPNPSARTTAHPATQPSIPVPNEKMRIKLPADLHLMFVAPADAHNAPRVIVQNSGQGAAGPFTIAFQCLHTVDGSFNLSCAGLHAPIQVSGLAAGASEGHYVSLPPQPYGAGVWKVTAIADSTHQVTESNENNNQHAQTWCFSGC